jgi:hypothetical protein
MNKYIKISVMATLIIGCCLFLWANMPIQIDESHYKWGWPVTTVEEYSPDFGDMMLTGILNISPLIIIIFLILTRRILRMSQPALRLSLPSEAGVGERSEQEARPDPGKQDGHGQ